MVQQEMEKHREMTSADRDYQKRKRLASIVSLLVLIAFFVVITVFIGKPMVEGLADPEEFRQWVDSHGPMGRLAFLGMMTLQVVVAMIPGEPLEIAAGYVFGNFEGLLLCILGAVLGTMIIFGFTRLFGVKMVEAFISREKLEHVKLLQNAARLNFILFIVFLIPGTPKDVLTYVAGLTPIRLSTFLLLTTIARIPSVVSSTIGGNALGTENYAMAVAVFLVTAVLSGIGALLYRHHSQKKQKKEGESNSSATEH